MFIVIEDAAAGKCSCRVRCNSASGFGAVRTLDQRSVIATVSGCQVYCKFQHFGRCSNFISAAPAAEGAHLGSETVVLPQSLLFFDYQFARCS